MPKYVLVHDIGTTGNKCCIFDVCGNLVFSKYSSYETCFHKNGYQEHINISNKDILCLTFSGHMMGCIPIDKHGNLLLEKVPIYSDSRANKQAKKIMNMIGGFDKWYLLTGTGQVPDCYSISKYLWIKENLPEIYKKTYKFLNTKDYIIFKLTGKFITDYSDASDMGLLDIRKGEWSKEIISIAGICESVLPDLYKSTDNVGLLLKSAANDINLPAGLPVFMGGGDVCCAALGAGMNKEGMSYISIGSANWFGAFINMPNLDVKTKPSVFFHIIPNKYVIHQFMIGGGICYQWLRDNLFSKEKDLSTEFNINFYDYLDDKAALIKPGSDNLIFLPYLRGDWSGCYNPNARGAFIGLGLAHNKSHLIRSALEGVGYSLRVLKEMLEHQGIKINEARIIGGGATSVLWKQIIADICKVPIITLKLSQEAGSLGAAIAALVGIGIFNNFEEIDKVIQVKDIVKPISENFKLYDELYYNFKEAYKNLIPIFNNIAFL